MGDKRWITDKPRKEKYPDTHTREHAKQRLNCSIKNNKTDQQHSIHQESKLRKERLSVLYLNARSVSANGKADGIRNDLVEEDIDVCVIMETWLTGDENTDTVVCGNLTPQGYALVHTPRVNQRGGGVAIVCKNSFQVTKQTVTTYESFEHMEVLLQTGCDCVRLCVVYRPTSLSKPQFLEDFSDYLDQNTTTSGKLLILGDFNIQMDNETDTTARDMKDLIYSFNMGSAC